MDKFIELEAVIARIKENVTKFYQKGNDTAGKKARADFQIVKLMAQEIREEIQTIRNQKKNKD